jgi:hypothetical protein
MSADERGEGRFITVIDETAKEFAIARTPSVGSKPPAAKVVDHSLDLAGQRAPP